MSIDDEKVVNLDSKQVKDTLGIGVYTVYDCVSKQFDCPMCIPITKVDDYFTILVNDVNSKYFLHENDYIINKIGDFDTDSGEIHLHFVERISTLDRYIDNQKRKLQVIIQTLNYLPQGYFKMPEEMKTSIQDSIDLSIKNYVENFVIPDMDVSKAKYDNLLDKYNELEERFKVVQG